VTPGPEPVDGRAGADDAERGASGADELGRTGGGPAGRLGAGDAGRALVTCGRAAAEAAGRAGGRAVPGVELEDEPFEDDPLDGEPDGGGDDVTVGRAGAGRTRVVDSSFTVGLPDDASPESLDFTSAASVVIGAAPPPGLC